MSHTIRWTIEKITQRLALIDPLVYRRRADLPNFHYSYSPELDEHHSSLSEPETGPEIIPNTYWGIPFTEFTLRSSFQIPADWDADQPIALYLPDELMNDGVRSTGVLLADDP